MKKFAIVLLLSVFAFSAEAKKDHYDYHTPGYWGNVELNTGAMLGGGSNVGFSTTHGYCIGHGVSMGLGLGLFYDTGESFYAWSIPFYLETKYSPLKTSYSPFVSLKTGFSVNDAECPGFHLAPAIGMDFGRFSMFMRYGLNLYPVSVDIDINMPDADIEINTEANLKMHTLSLGFAVNF